MSRRFGPEGYRERMRRATATGKIEAVQQVEIGIDLAEQMIGWPERRIRELDQAPTATSLRRGGY
jgi:hypothetical protein